MSAKTRYAAHSRPSSHRRRKRGCTKPCKAAWPKPGRPSHALHTYWVGNLRLVLDMQMRSGKQHSSGHAKEGLGKLLDELGTRGPALVRGDCGYGN